MMTTMTALILSASASCDIPGLPPIIDPPGLNNSQIACLNSCYDDYLERRDACLQYADCSIRQWCVAHEITAYLLCRDGCLLPSSFSDRWLADLEAWNVVNGDEM